MDLDFQERLRAFKQGSTVNATSFGIVAKAEETVQEKPAIISRMANFLVLSRDVEEVWEHIKNASTVLYVKPVQSGKTGQIYKIVEHLYRTHIVLFVSDKNKALAGQTNKRGKGWIIKDFSEVKGLMEVYNFLLKYAGFVRNGQGKKQIAHFLMEYRNIEVLIPLIAILPQDIPIVLVIDEGDKNRNTDALVETDEDEDEELDLPPVTKGLLICKNALQDKKNGSMTIYVTATPQGVMCSEKDDNRKVVYQEPFMNYNGPGLGKDVDIQLVECMSRQSCKARDRWTGMDRYENAYYSGVDQAVSTLINLDSKDTCIKQVMLISLENRNAVQERLASYVQLLLNRKDAGESVGIVVFNGDVRNKDKNSPLLSDKIAAMQTRKIIVISGFCASRGVSFTDFTDKENQFELVIQVHAAKVGDPLNSSLQAMRIFGPARRTVTRAMMFCNRVTYNDCTINFREGYRICQELAEGKEVIYAGGYDRSRPLTQKSNFRFMKQDSGFVLLRVSEDPKDWDRITASV